MTKRRVETAVSMVVDRNFPASSVVEATKLIQSSGAADYMMMWDQLTSWIPPCLWTPENTPQANLWDVDSFSDWNVMGAYGVSQAPGLGMSISMDAVRRGPPELIQTMLSVANITEGKAIYQLGGGEIKQTEPFGYRRAEGLTRLEEFYKLFHKFWESDKPIDFEGKYWKMKQATLGKAKRYRPQIWGLGGGPRIIDLATSYADGFASSIPLVWATPEQAAEQIKAMKEQLEKKGRDPEKFSFGAWAMVLAHEDMDLIKRSMSNPLIAWNALHFGRLIMPDWRKEGLEPPMPDDWHYALKLLPTEVTKEQAMEWLSRLTPAHSEKSWFYGTPKDIAGRIQPYIEAGVNWVVPVDMLAMVLQPEDAAKSLIRCIEIARIVKQNNS